MEVFLVIAFTHFLALLSPGPDFFLILTSLLQKGLRYTYGVILGITLGNALILMVCVFGFMVLGNLSTTILLVLKWLGAGYLAYLSFLCFRAAQGATLNIVVEENNLVEQKYSYKSKFKSLALGLQSSLLNPKNIMFYSSLMLLIQQEFSLFQKLLMSGWMIAVVLGWNLLLVRLLRQERVLAHIKRSAKGLYYCSGIAFIIFAVLLVVYS
ncbi:MULTISPECIES: LysE family translocator [Acinetobacter calcoaceticus/baumannii complex]|uniref:LysE family translocator n=1 Tax=Acinetobacter calcoaceticus/baumannii complex TaxID=909768 RepID=UPI0007083707|nr:MULTISPECIES: LysE family translocator [Acinetobacter calcoaceticus/baumannii complex]KQE90898.1 amino acid transporter [Acinetobacter lactucae]MCG9512893.1 LysE family translocator [Acinetobacter pittii]